MALEDDILSALAREPGLKYREVAQRLGVEDKVVKLTLRQLKARSAARQGADYRWWLVRPGEAIAPLQREAAETLLTRLCGYYLHCLGLDPEAGVSVKARSQPPDFTELPTLPFGTEQRAVTAFPGVLELFQSLRRSNGRPIPYVGYPVRVSFRIDRDGWEGFVVDPVLIWEFEDGALPPVNEPVVSGDVPVLNCAVLRAFAVEDAQHVMEEAVALAEELGLNGATPPDLDDLIDRLVEIRSEWDWKEEMNPAALSVGASLAAINEPGIYNRAVVLGCEGSRYTKGLEQELAKLQLLPEADYAGTALGAWLRRDFSAFIGRPLGDAGLLEPLPLNSEQREAIEKSLSRPLTVITGPPGTGKSQVVASLLVNAAKRGLRVLFSSKNHKAVDVVLERVNALGPHDILHKLGKSENPAKLAGYITMLLGPKATVEDEQNHREAEHDYATLTGQTGEIQLRAHKVVELRNAVDATEQQVEDLRKELGEDLFQRFRRLNADKLRDGAAKLGAAAGFAERSRQAFLTRLFWFRYRSARIESLRAVAADMLPLLRSAEVEAPALPRIDMEVAGWQEVARLLALRAEQVRAIAHYSGLLAALNTGDRIEDLYLQIMGLSDECAGKSKRVWESWVRLAPNRVTNHDVHPLDQFGATLQNMANAAAQNTAVDRAVLATYSHLFPHVVSQLPCWAVTSLSARGGRVPLEPGFFDLVVVDEASQCDIASILPLLYRAKSAVIIGDQQQLKFISGISQARDNQLLGQHGLTATHIEWGFSNRSVFELANGLAPPDDKVELRDHHRSHAAIIGFSNQHFYGGRLRVATKYNLLKRPPGQPAIRWIHVQGNVEPARTGAINDAEAQAVVRELERIVIQQGFSGSVGVVTPFREQANHIRVILHHYPQLNAMVERSELLVETVYKFQGDERDVMIFSPVVSTGMPVGAARYLQKTPNLFNVAITRARAALVVVGCQDAARASGIEHLSAFADYVAAGAGPVEAEGMPADFDAGPAYPTVANPNDVSEWEKHFYRYLYSAGLRPIPQYVEEKFALDFALIRGNRRLNIEVDGERYHRDWNGELLRRDQLRNMRLIELGWDVMRFWVYELRDEMEACIERVRRWSA